MSLIEREGEVCKKNEPLHKKYLPSYIVNVIENYKKQPKLGSILIRKVYGIPDKLYGTDISKRYAVVFIDELEIAWGRPINKNGKLGSIVCVGADYRSVYEYDEDILIYEIISSVGEVSLESKIGRILKIYRSAL